ncbi:MAG TPA: cytochrome c [Bryobacteraceae bacterium]|nr:cytochrome c [Bryobacteraceae bacterium]
MSSSHLLNRRRLISVGIGLLAGAVTLSLRTSAHDVITTPITFSREISRLFYKRCASCHHEGGSAFSLMTYEQARPWAKAIKEEVLERRMPPWGAVKGFGEFKDDQGLTQEQLELISEWVEGGAPEGEATLLPKQPDFTEKSVPTPTTGPDYVVDGSLILKEPVILMGIGPKVVLEGASMQVIAERPDGSVEPLLWLYNFKPEFSHDYFYKSPLSLPAGTKVEIAPLGAGTIRLMSAKAHPVIRAKRG